MGLADYIVDKTALSQNKLFVEYLESVLYGMN